MPPKPEVNKDPTRTVVAVPLKTKTDLRINSSVRFQLEKPSGKTLNAVLPDKVSTKSTVAKSTSNSVSCSSAKPVAGESHEESSNEDEPTSVIKCSIEVKRKVKLPKTPYTFKASPYLSRHQMSSIDVKKIELKKSKPAARFLASKVKSPLLKKPSVKNKSLPRYKIGANGRMTPCFKQKPTFTVDCDVTNVKHSFERIGYAQVEPEQYWNVYWASAQTTRLMFGADSTYRMDDDQLFNHFPNHYELSRKDLLVKNIKRYRKDLERLNSPFAAKDAQGNYIYMDIIPTTFNLPLDYSMFVEEYRRNPQSTWIMKPSGRSQGSGIFLINRLAKLKKWCKDNEAPFTNVLSKDAYVISRYIDNPFLIGGKKFDMRLYVLVTSFRPLKVYKYEEGFCRFCTVKYDTSTAEIDNMFVHLTNVSIQKTGDEYNETHGGKLCMENFRLFMEGTRGLEQTEELFEKITWLIVHSLKAVAPLMTPDRHCFECYGYDIIIDDQLKPWLVEINASPSLSSTTATDRILKSRLIEDILSVVLPPDGVPDIHWDKIPAEEDYGRFELLLDEELLEVPEEQKAAGRNGQGGKAGSYVAETVHERFPVNMTYETYVATVQTFFDDD